MRSLTKLKNKARAHEQRAEWAEAIQAYLEVLRRGDEGDAETELPLYNRIGDLYVRVGRAGEAVAFYEEAADRYAEAGLYNNAIALCNKALRYAPKRADLYLKLGKLCATQGFLTDSRRWFLEYAALMDKAGRRQQAFQALEEFADLSDDAATRELLGRQLAANGMVEDAVGQLARAYRRRVAANETAEAETLRAEILKLDPDADLTESASAAGPRAPGSVASGDVGAGLGPLELETAAGAAGLGSGPAPAHDRGPGVGLGPGEDGEPDIEPLPLLDVDPGAGPARPAAAAPAGDIAEAAPPDVETRAAPEANAVPEFELLDLDFVDLGGGIDARSAMEAEAEAEPDPDPEPDLEVELLAAPDTSGLDWGLLDLDREPGAEDAEPEAEPEPEPEAQAEPELEPEPEPLPLIGFDDPETEALVAVDPAQETGGGLAATFDLPDFDGADSADAGAGLEPDLGSDPEPDLGFDLEPAIGSGFESDAGPGSESEPEPIPLLDVDEPGPAAASRPGAGTRAELERAHAALADAGDLREAIRVIEELIRMEPDEARLYQQRVEYAFRLGDRDLLIQAYLDLASCLGRGGAARKAQTVYRRVLELAPQNEAARAALEGPGKKATASPPQEYVDLAGLLREEVEAGVTTRFIVAEEEPTGDEDRDFAEMLSQFKAKISENLPAEESSSHYDLGLAFKNMGLLDEAITEFQTALRGGHDRLRVYEELGQCFMLKRQYPVAIKVLSRALRLAVQDDAELLGIHYQLGRCYEEIGDAGEAKEAYERVMGLDVNFRDVAKRLTRL